MTKKNTARLAGLVYLFLVLSGIFYLLYVPSQLIVSGDASATANFIEWVPALRPNILAVMTVVSPSK